jgi:hypothetical protein
MPSVRVGYLSLGEKPGASGRSWVCDWSCLWWSIKPYSQLGEAVLDCYRHCAFRKRLKQVQKASSEVNYRNSWHRHSWSLTFALLASLPYLTPVVEKVFQNHSPGDCSVLGGSYKWATSARNPHVRGTLNDILKGNLKVRQVGTTTKGKGANKLWALNPLPIKSTPSTLCHKTPD